MTAEPSDAPRQHIADETLSSPGQANIGGVPGGRIGPYKLLSLLGEGGFGAVYLAEQTEPVRRRVALKLIKPGYASTAALRRFEQEAEVLGRLEHDGIARVCEAGLPKRRRPYLVMQHVQDVPITACCGFSMPHCARQDTDVGTSRI